jgi:hypothetical protein
MHFLLALIELRVEKNFGIAPFLESRGSVTWCRSHDMFYRQKEFLKHDFFSQFKSDTSKILVMNFTLG